MNYQPNKSQGPKPSVTISKSMRRNHRNRRFVWVTSAGLLQVSLHRTPFGKLYQNSQWNSSLKSPFLGQQRDKIRGAAPEGVLNKGLPHTMGSCNSLLRCASHSMVSQPCFGGVWWQTWEFHVSTGMHAYCIHVNYNRWIDRSMQRWQFKGADGGEGCQVPKTMWAKMCWYRISEWLYNL